MLGHMTRHTGALPLNHVLGQVETASNHVGFWRQADSPVSSSSQGNHGLVTGACDDGPRGILLLPSVHVLVAQHG